MKKWIFILLSMAALILFPLSTASRASPADLSFASYDIVITYSDAVITLSTSSLSTSSMSPIAPIHPIAPAIGQNMGSLIYSATERVLSAQITTIAVEPLTILEPFIDAISAVPHRQPILVHVALRNTLHTVAVQPYRGQQTKFPFVLRLW